ncbi:LON peptidase substrate-binding domain-containing protein [Bacteroidota bacterium]
MEKIGLFPIKNVLFPKSVLPLHVFEGRYIRLINLSFKNDIPFGINLKESGRIQEFGCLAKVTEVVRHFDDGRMDILLEGLTRYKILKREKGDSGYDIAEITLIQDEDESLNSNLFLKCIETYNSLADLLNSIDIKKIDTNKLMTTNPSYYLSQKSGLTLKQKYRILEITSENERLEFILKHLKSVFPMIKEAEFVTKIVKNDGYYRPAYYQK